MGTRTGQPAPQPSAIEPMLSVEAPRPFNDPAFVHEIKYDGWRLLASSGGATVELKTRNGANATKLFPEIWSSLVDLPGARHVFDGEFVRLARGC